jgi:hypothetical protein
MTKKNEKVFVKVTNVDIFERIIALEKSINDFQKDNQAAHSLIIEENISTRGRINLIKYVSGVAISLVLILFGYVVFK